MAVKKEEKKEEEKDITKVKLYAPIEYWSKILIVLDRKLEMLSTTYGFGEIGLKIVVHNGKIMYSMFSDEVKIKQTKGGL